jgi:putative sterol carrier protein
VRIVYYRKMPFNGANLPFIKSDYIKELSLMPDSVQKVFEEIGDHFDPNAWGSQDAVLNFDITEDGGGQWTATIKSGILTVEKGLSSEPDMTMSTTGTDMLALVNGDLNAVSAFMQGRVHIDGDMSLAMKLQALLNS